jgi:5'-nucleotidase
MKKILISNDDGIDSPGIQALAEAAKAFGKVYVVAPHRERSTSGHSLTLHKPVRILPVAEGQFAATGTPADCIYLGVHEVLKGKPDLILSGINNGANLGTDVHYSGTVAAAREGALMNIPSYAFSMVELTKFVANSPRPKLRFEMAAGIIRLLLEQMIDIPFPSHTVVNVNIPNVDREKIRGVRIARQGFRYYSPEVTKRTDPRGRDYYWVGGPYIGFEKSETSDCHAVEEGYVAVTPITIDCTHEKFLQELSAKSLKV